MAKRKFLPEDAYRLRLASDPDLSPDGRRVAFVLAETDEEHDRMASSIWVAASDGSVPARPFSEGPGDRRPRWSPDGRWLAYISSPADKPHDAHVRLAPLDGGTPRRLGDRPGPVSDLAWSPDSDRLVLVCRVGQPDPSELTAEERNAPRVVRGLAARLDGVGWQDGRRQLFSVELDDGSATQLTRGEFDNLDPSFSPDGETIVFASDRHPRRDDRQFHSDVWVMPAGGGKPRRLTSGKGRVGFPTFSPDGSLIAFAGQDDFSWDRNDHIYVVPPEGGGVQRVAPDTDRGVTLFPGLPSPFRWLGEQELGVLFGDRGGIALHRARLGSRTSQEVLGGDIEIDGLAAVPGRRTIAFTAAWPDRPSEVFASARGGAEPRRVTSLNDDFLEEVELSPVTRSVVARPDGTDVEYFALLPPGRRGGRLPLHLDIHGGPHGSWPVARALAAHQAMAAAGYAVLLPNPRGSSGYGQAFTEACTGDWGGADFEDIVACCDDLVARGIADGDRMFVSGASYGGFMTSWIVGHTSRFRAATAVAAVVDQTNQALASDIPYFSLFNMGGAPWERAGEYDKRSPLSYLTDVETPVLLVHWEGDLRVPISQAEELYTGLRLLGKEAELVRYPGGFHIMRTPSQGVDRVRRTLAWNEGHDLRGGRKARERGSVDPGGEGLVAVRG